MPTDDFELVLERCRARLCEITLTVPDLESGPPRKIIPVSLFPRSAAAPPQPLPPPPSAPMSPPARLSAPVAPPPDPRPAPRPLPADFEPLEPEEDEIFPPAPTRPRAPLPQAPAWKSAPAASATPAARPARSARSLRLRLAAGAAAAGTAAGALWLADRPSGYALIPLDGKADALAVRSDGDLLVAEGTQLLTFLPDGKLAASAALDAPVACLRWDNGSLWSADGRTPALIEQRDGARPTVFSLNHVPGGLFVRDKYLWTSDRAAHTLHQYLISRSILGVLLQPLDLYSVAGVDPETFAVDENGDLWVVDADSRRLFRLKPEGGSYKPVAAAALSPLIGPVGGLRGLNIQDGALWILATPEGSGRSALHRIPLKALDWTPAA